MYLNSFIKYNTNISIKILFSHIKIIGVLGVLEHQFNYFMCNVNSKINKFYYINPIFSTFYKNCFIISHMYFNIFFSDLFKLILGTNYGWFFSFNITGRGFSFRLKKRFNQIFLKIKVGYSHFVYFPINYQLLVKIAKKRNKLIIFSLNFWLISTIVWQLRHLRSKHTYKIQGISFLNEKIIVKPGKKKQI